MTGAGYSIAASTTAAVVPLCLRAGWDGPSRLSPSNRAVAGNGEICESTIEQRQHRPTHTRVAEQAFIRPARQRLLIISRGLFLNLWDIQASDSDVLASRSLEPSHPGPTRAAISCRTSPSAAATSCRRADHFCRRAPGGNDGNQYSRAMGDRCERL